MKMQLSCYCCGSTNFKLSSIVDLDIIEGNSYLYQENQKENKVTCKNCGFEDYMENLPIKFFVDPYEEIDNMEV